MSNTLFKKRIYTIWRFAKKYWLLFLIAETCILVSYAVSIVLPLNLVKLTDEVLFGGKSELLNDIIIAYVGLFLIATIFNLIYAYTWQTLNNKYVVDVKNELFKRTLYAKADYLSSINSGDIMSRIDGDADQFIHVVQRNIFHFVNSILMCAGIIYMVSKINLEIAIMLIVAAITPIMFTKYCGRFAEKYSLKSREISGKLFGKIFEILKGMREIKLFCAQVWAKSNIFASLNKLIMLGNSVKRLDFFVAKGTYFVNLSTSLVIYGYSAHLILNNQLTIGLFLAIIEYIFLLHKKFNWILRIYLDWNSRKVSIDRVNEILDTESEFSAGNTKCTNIDTIEFNDVSFGYNKELTIKNLSFRINAGEKVAIVGVSGVGKTTISNLLMKFYNPNSGVILINGDNLKDIRCKDIRALIGIVQQDIIIFDETIRFNLLLGNTNCNEDELLLVCKQVGILELIKNLPQGLDTKIGLNVHGLSGGQKQRIMIARTLLRGYKTIILDEATSALDVETEQNIMKNYNKTISETTMIIISHRLNTIKNCDKIIVINDGRVESVGSHIDLIKKSKTYSKLFGGNIL